MIESVASPQQPALHWLDALREPSVVQSWSLAEWENAVRLARRLRLLGRLAEAIDRAGLLPQVPACVQRHLVSEKNVSRYQTQAARWAMEQVALELAGADFPVVLLKGGAYIAQGLQIAAGRLPSDLDILVPKAALEDVIRRLQSAGWVAMEMDAHDTRYYEEWSHEVPPMRHAMHAIELDLHHNILPPVARTHVDVALLLERLVPTPAPGWFALDLADQVLHSAAHLFHDSDIQDRLRDLVDIDSLLQIGLGSRSNFWDELLVRGKLLGLQESLALALVMCVAFTTSSVPGAVLKEAVSLGLPWRRRLWLLPLVRYLLNPAPLDAAPSWQRRTLATFFLIRYQLLRLPLSHLVAHLVHKFSSSTPAAADRAPGGQARRQL